jgi:hypothetical protein
LDAFTGSARMKKLLTAVVLGAVAMLAVLYIGYYETLEDGDIETILFIKKYPTFQMKFYNIHANDGDHRKVEKLSNELRQDIIDYCKYRLGIDTEVKAQSDV